MNEASANLPPFAPALPPVESGESGPAKPKLDDGWPAGPKLDEGWSRNQMIFFITLALATHVALIFLFGTKKQFVPRPVTDVPQLKFASHADELLEFDNPALFALPNPRDFASAVWQQSSPTPDASFRYAEDPRWLKQPDPGSLGAAFSRFMQTNRFENLQLVFKPLPVFAELRSSLGWELPQASTLRISGALAQRPLLAQPALPSLEYPVVIAPSKVQVVVDPTGNVISAVLQADGGTPTGDTNAIALARSLKFAPAAKLAFGEVIFYWHTVPPPSTNTPVNLEISP